MTTAAQLSGLLVKKGDIVEALKSKCHRAKVGSILIRGDEHPMVIWRSITYNVRKRRLTIRVDERFSRHVHLTQIEVIHMF